jgi:cytochrome c-type biogenesis protein CcmH/NrfG
VLPEIGLFFSDQPPTRTPTILRLGSQGIEIPPGESRYLIRDSYTLPVEADLLAIQPHAHYRAREIRGTAQFPDGTSRLVMHITDWDFRWQHVYRQVTPIRLPKGTRLSMEYTYDNSADNVRNPQLPPARVYWGQRSNDEMGDLWFQLLATNDRDRQLMTSEIATKMTIEDIAGYETMLRADPKDAELHDDVALLHRAVGQMAPAVRHFEASVLLKPDSAAAHFNLGTALAQAGSLDDAVAAFRAALVRRADYALAHNNLGQVLLAQGKTGDALKHLQQAVQLDAVNPQALFGLAEAYAAVGSFDLAVETIDRAIKLPMPEALATQVLARRAQYLLRRPH